MGEGKEHKLQGFTGLPGLSYTVWPQQKKLQCVMKQIAPGPATEVFIYLHSILGGGL